MQNDFCSASAYKYKPLEAAVPQCRVIELLPGDFASDIYAIEGVVPLPGNPYFQSMWIVQEMINAGGFAASVRQIPLRSVQSRAFIGVLETMKGKGYGIPEVGSNASDNLFLSDSRREKCAEQRDKIFALLGFLTRRAIKSTAKMQPDYSMGVEEVFVTAVSWCDAMWEERDLRTAPQTLTESVADFAYTLGLDILEAPFKSWLRQRIHKPPGYDTDII